MNARSPLLIPWHDGCWEHVHPDVVYLPQGFAGYPYWMAFTPYPRGNDRFENPTLRASRDGLAWRRLPGVPEPLVPTPKDPETHHADPDIVFHDSRLHVIYATISDWKSTFSIMSSRDAMRWTEPRIMCRGTLEVSPACVVNENLWHVWFVRQKGDGGPSELLCRQGDDPMSLGNERLCQLDIPGHVLWHIDVLRVGRGYEALIAAYPERTDDSRTCLFHAISEDGLHFVLCPTRAILSPSKFGWDNREIYRSTFLKQLDGTYRVWYSAASWGNHWGIGHVQGPLDALMENASSAFAPVPGLPTKLSGDLKGGFMYLARNHLPAPVVAYLRRIIRGHAGRAS
jgi:hypothetical protein